MRRTNVRALAVVAALAVGAAACGGDDGGGAAPSGPETTEAPTTEAPVSDGQLDMAEPEIDEPIEPMRSLSDSGQEQVAEDADTVMIAAAIDVQQFWVDAYPAVYGEPFQELEGGLWSYSPDTSPADLPPCGDVASYDDVAENAFYCSGVDLIAWDRDGLIEPFIDEFGAFTAALVMAHEYGHAVQARTGDFTALPGVISELQADCFAGAWVQHVAEGGSDIFRAELDELDVAVAGLLEIRDVPGSSPDNPSAHGSGFDRVSAFADGLDEGAERCAGYGEEPPVVVQEVFQDAEDEANAGDLPSDELLPILVDDLEAYYTELFADLGGQWQEIDQVLLFDPDADEVTCGGSALTPEEATFSAFYCVDDNVVALDGANRLPALEAIGDFALGADLARQWAFAAQVQAGNLDNTRETFLHADCLTGLYAGDLYFELRPDAGLRLSPGDLDEALISFLGFGAGESDLSPFERSEAFRVGFLGGVADCDAILG